MPSYNIDRRVMSFLFYFVDNMKKIRFDYSNKYVNQGNQISLLSKYRDIFSCIISVATYG